MEKESSIQKLSDHLVSIGVQISSEEIQFILLHQFKQQQQWKRNLYKFSFIPSISAGRIITTVVFAVVGIFLAPVLGVGVVVGALVGAAIGWKLGSALFPEKKPIQQIIKPSSTQQSKQDTEKVTSNPGFDSPPQAPSIGGVVPMIFSKYGGVQSVGNVIYSRLVTSENATSLYLIISLGLGKIKNINYYKMLVNGQNVYKNFSPGYDFTWVYANGDNNQTIFNNADIKFKQFYSQAITPNVNNSLGVSYLGQVTTINNGTSFTVGSLPRLADFNYSDRYRVFRTTQSNDWIEFRVIDKNESTLRITIQIIDRSSTGLTLSSFAPASNALFFTSYSIFYETLKKCTTIEMSLSFEVWGINTVNAYFNNALIFLVSVDNGLAASYYYVLNAKPSIFRRYLKIEGLPYGFHKVSITPFTWINLSYTIRRMGETGNFTSHTPNILGGSGITFTFENPSSTATTSQIHDATMPVFRLGDSNVSQVSADRGPVGKLTNVNECVYPDDIDQTAFTIFPKQALALIKVITSDRISGRVPTFTHFIDEGIEGKVIVAYGVASTGTTGTTLIFNSILSIDNWEDNKNLIVKNIKKNSESFVIEISKNQIDLVTDINLEIGESFYVYYLDSLGYFPDVFVHTLTNPLGGLGKIISDRFIDFPSIIKSKIFCIQNNFYYDNIIDSSISWIEWVNLESTANLLLTTKYGGLYGLIPEEVKEPVAIFTASNILNGNFKESSAQRQKTNAIQLTYRAKDGDNFYQKTISTMTEDAYNNVESYYPESISFDSITNEYQAVRVSQVALKSRRIQDKVIEFYTGIQGFFLRETDLIIVQYGLTELESETSGFCLSATALSSGIQTIELSTNLKDSYPTGTTATIYHLYTGNIQKNKTFSIVSGKLVISGLTEEIKPPINGSSGDVIILNGVLEDKIFRISSIEPEAYKVKITAVYWNASILDDYDIVTVGKSY